MPSSCLSLVIALLTVSFMCRVDKNLAYGVRAKLSACGLQSGDFAPGQKVKLLARSAQLLGKTGNNRWWHDSPRFQEQNGPFLRESLP